MNEDPLSGTGYDRYDAGTQIEVGVIVDSNVGEGTCRVETRGGRLLDRVRVAGLGGGSGGKGLYSMPTPRTRCVVLVTGEMFQENVLLGTFPPLDREDKKSQVGPSSDLIPGMVAHHFEDGGRFLLSPSGMVDIKAHPWAHRTYIPSEHMIKERVRNFERQTGPHDLFRRFSSTEEENTFMELMLNDRFLYRKEDEAPPIIWTLGDNTRGDTSPFNPESLFRHFYQVEHRPRSSADPVSRHTEEIGHVEGVVSRETNEMVSPKISIETTEGQFEGKDGSDVFRKKAEKDGELIADIEIREDGHVHLKTPEWQLDLRPDNTATLTNEDTEIHIDGKTINVGKGELEQMALGNTLVELLNEIIKWQTQHTHPTPVGPTGPPITAAQLTAIQSSYKLKSGEKAKILSDEKNVSKT